MAELKIRVTCNSDPWAQVRHPLEMPRNTWGKGLNISKGSDWERVWVQECVHLCAYVLVCIASYKWAATGLPCFKFLSLVQTLPPGFYLPASWSKSLKRTGSGAELWVLILPLPHGAVTSVNCFNLSVPQYSGINDPIYTNLLLRRWSIQLAYARKNYLCCILVLKSFPLLVNPSQPLLCPCPISQRICTNNPPEWAARQSCPPT